LGASEDTTNEPQAFQLLYCWFPDLTNLQTKSKLLNEEKQLTVVTPMHSEKENGVTPIPGVIRVALVVDDAAGVGVGVERGEVVGTVVGVTVLVGSAVPVSVLVVVDEGVVVTVFVGVEDMLGAVFAQR
jgi:hypothetical protein